MQNKKRIHNTDGFRKVAYALALFLLLATTRIAFAHNGVEHVMGTVTQVSAQAVSIETTEKKVVEVELSLKTKYTRDGKAASASELKIGDRIMVNAKEVDKKLVADSVKLGAAAPNSDHAGHAKK